MITINGNATCKLDDKFRLSLPAKFLRQIEALQEKDWFIMKPSLDLPCIELYPKASWVSLQKNELEKLDRLATERQHYLLMFMKNHQLVKLDKSNRLLIPQELLEFANIKKEVMLAPIIDVIQIWDKETYDRETDKLLKNRVNLTNIALSQRNV